jgi:hypothetical protein
LAPCQSFAFEKGFGPVSRSRKHFTSHQDRFQIFDTKKAKYKGKCRLLKYSFTFFPTPELNDSEYFSQIWSKSLFSNVRSAVLYPNLTAFASWRRQIDYITIILEYLESGFFQGSSLLL